MAYSFSPKVVTDGLVLYLDAANPRSYTSGSSVWNDLTSNGNSGSLVNGPTFSSANGGSIVFDGVDDYVNVSTLIWTPTAFTVSWFTNGSSRNNYNQAIGSSNGWGTFNCHTDSNGSMFVGTDVATRLGPPTIPNNIYILGIYQHFTFTYGGGIGTFYKNANLISSKSMTTPVAWTGFSIGAPNSSTINGTIANVQIYNRALSAQEVLQNYNATKGRFGL